MVVQVRQVDQSPLPPPLKLLCHIQIYVSHLQHHTSCKHTQASVAQNEKHSPRLGREALFLKLEASSGAPGPGHVGKKADTRESSRRYIASRRRQRKRCWKANLGRWSLGLPLLGLGLAMLVDVRPDGIYILLQV